MPTDAEERRAAAAAAVAGRCPRCGAPRGRSQDYCLECGARLPGLSGWLPRLRNTWIERLGWYPGDWVVSSVATLAVAVLGGGAAVAFSSGTKSPGGGATVVASTVPGLGIAAPTTTSKPSTVAATPSRPRRVTTPTTSTPGGTPPAGTVGSWPASRSGWTVVLASFPATTGTAVANAAAASAANAGLTEVGIIRSNDFPSLQPGYLVLFSGVYTTDAEAQGGLGSVLAAGFGGAYTRQIAR